MTVALSRSRPAVLLVFAAAILAVVLGSSAAPLASAEIVDGRSGGDPDFFWLPPTVDSAPAPTGPFDSAALRDLAVEICELEPGGDCAPGEPLERFTSTSRPLVSRIFMNRRDEAYSALWLPASSRTRLDRLYRVSVFRDGAELGHLDVDFVRHLWDLWRVDDSQYRPALRGLPFLIRFRVQEPTVLTSVTVNEVESSGGDPGDWIELYNAAAVALRLDGYIIKDNDDTHVYTFPAGSEIPADSFLVAGEEDLGFGLGGGDSARLFMPDGVTLVDSYTWEEHAATTYARCPNGAGPFLVSTTPTQGGPNDCSVVILLNELESSGGVPGDWAELYNPGPRDEDLGGFVFKDNDDGHAYTIPAGTVITAHGYYVLEEADFGFGLGSADSARLFTPDGGLADSFSWTSHATTTYGRCPNGIGDFGSTASPSKGATNECASPYGSIKLNEVESQNGDPGDWAELYNAGSEAVDLSGLVFRDNDDTHAYAIPAGTTLPGNGFFVLEEGDFGFGLGGGDSARLFEPDGVTIVDSYTWETHAATTYGRCPNGESAFETTNNPTKGAANDCVTAANSVLINEIESSGGVPGDWIELINTGANPVDLSGFQFRDNDDAHIYTIPAGTLLAPNDYLVLEEADLGFGLGGGDSARLFTPLGAELIDSHTWTEHAVTTYGRCPNGLGDFDTTDGATKGSANDCGSAFESISVNEVESSGGDPGDWVELYNTSSDPVDVSGLGFRDNDPGHAIYVIPLGAVIPGNGFLVLEEAQFGFGLGSADTANVFAPDGVTVIDSYSWATHAATTYGRCPDGAGSFSTTNSPTKAAANDCTGSADAVKINEVESSGGEPGDWIELYNTSPLDVDISGWVISDSDDTHDYVIPAGTVLVAEGYAVIEEAALGFGLGDPDSVRLFLPDGATLADSHAWIGHATTTYGRCPNGTGAFTTTTASSKGASNTCPGDPVDWPGSPDIATADLAGTFGGDLSGLAYEASGTSDPGILWAVHNGDGLLYRLEWDGSAWTPDTDDNWGSGKNLNYPDGLGTPDSEGVTISGTGSAGGVYVATERNNDASGVSRNAILRFDPAAAGSDLTATHEWDVTTQLPAVGANLGIEAIAFVPDAFLVASGFVDETTGLPYDPTGYADHGGGLFFVGLEANGGVYAFALDHAAGSATLVASIDTALAGVMALEFDAELGDLWAVCDDTCSGTAVILTVDAAGAFVVDALLARPAGMPNINNEGFAISSQAECTAGEKPVYWSDDSETGGNAIRAGSLVCTGP